MLKHLLPFILVLLAFMLNGCLENALLLDINPDGSGTLTVRSLASPDLDPTGTSGFLEGLKTQLDDPSSFGEGLTLASIKETENSNGWKGYLAVYEFDDVTQVTMKSTKAEGPTEDGSSTMNMNNEVSYVFEFTQGSPSELRIIPLLDGEKKTPQKTPEETLGEDPFAQAGLEASDQVDNPLAGLDSLGDGMATAMMASMAPMMKGMRMSYLIRVNGEIKDTNAQHRPKENTILLMDMKVGDLVADAEAVGKLNGGFEGLKELAEANHPALKMQDPSEPLSIKFE